MPVGPLYDPPPLNLAYTTHHELPPPLMDTEELHRTNQALREKIFMRDKTAQYITGQTSNHSTQLTRTFRLPHRDEMDPTGPVPTQHDPTGHGPSQMGPHLHNRPDTGISYDEETPELEEIHEANMQVHREYLEALSRTERQWEELWRREDREREREIIRSYASLESRFWLDFTANHIPESQWRYARGSFEQQNNAPPPAPPSPLLILARPGTAARAAQDRRQERLRNFLTNGVVG